MIESDAFREPIDPLPAMREDEWLGNMLIEERTGTAPYRDGRWLYATASYRVEQDETAETIRQKRQLAVAKIVRDISAVFFAMHGLMLGPGTGGRYRFVVLKGEWMAERILADTSVMYIDTAFAFEGR